MPLRGSLLALAEGPYDEALHRQVGGDATQCEKLGCRDDQRQGVSRPGVGRPTKQHAMYVRQIRRAAQQHNQPGFRPLS